MKPISVKIDFEANASYIRYRELAPGEYVARTVDIEADGAVAADLDPHNRVLGIEVLGFDAMTVAAAAAFATDHGLEFPLMLGSLVIPINEISLGVAEYRERSAEQREMLLWRG